MLLGKPPTPTPTPSRPHRLLQSSPEAVDSQKPSQDCGRRWGHAAQKTNSAFPTNFQGQLGPLTCPRVCVCVCVCVRVCASASAHACARALSHVLLFGTLWTIGRQAPLSVGSSRPEYWSGLLFHSPDLSSLNLSLLICKVEPLYAPWRIWGGSDVLLDVPCMAQCLA